MSWTHTSSTVEDWGRFRVLVNNKDVTFFRDVPCVVVDYADAEPFGDTTATIEFPQVTALEELGVGDLDWCRYGARVDIQVVKPDDSVQPLWEGIWVADDSTLDPGSSGPLRLECIGALYQADLELQPPKVYAPNEIDMGYAIADALNSVYSRKYLGCARVETGIMTRERGSWDPVLTGYVQGLLAKMTTDDGTGQWTVHKDANRKPVIRLKDRTTVNWTIRAGQPGVGFALKADLTMSPNVIYGDGTAADGCRWRNTKYPNLRATAAPDYPYSNPANTIDIGDTDAGTTSGTGVSTWQREMYERGRGGSVTGTYSSADATRTRNFQRDAGLTIDGIVGPQTWTAAFEVGQNSGSLYGSYYQHLAAKAEVQPYRLGSDGSRLGDYEGYDPTIVRVARYVTYGDGISKAEGVLSAQKEILRDWIDKDHFPYYGRVTLTADPNEGSRFNIKSGDNLLLQGHRGEDRLLHVSGRSVSGAEVTLTVDEHARDLMTVSQLLERNRTSTDPARSSRRTSTRSRTIEERVVWDCESGAGIIPRFALGAGLWSVIRVVAGEYGTVVKSEITTDTAASKFAAAVFTKPVTPNDLIRWVGTNPLSNASDQFGWDTNADTLEEMGLAIAWGGPQQGAGYYPGNEEEDDPITGRLVDSSPWYFAADYPPWLWMAFWAPTACYVSGKLWAGQST